MGTGRLPGHCTSSPQLRGLWAAPASSWASVAADAVGRLTALRTPPWKAPHTPRQCRGTQKRYDPCLQPRGLRSGDPRASPPRSPALARRRPFGARPTRGRLPGSRGGRRARCPGTGAGTRGGDAAGGHTGPPPRRGRPEGAAGQPRAAGCPAAWQRPRPSPGGGGQLRRGWLCKGHGRGPAWSVRCATCSGPGPSGAKGAGGCGACRVQSSGGAVGRPGPPTHPPSLRVRSPKNHTHPARPQRHQRTRPLAPPREQPPHPAPPGGPVLREGCLLLQVTAGPGLRPGHRSGDSGDGGRGWIPGPAGS